MPPWPALALFVAAAAVVLLTPGPAVLYIVARSVDQGRVAGVVSTFGVGFGTLFHVAAAALGVSALLVSSTIAFEVVRYLGAAYLVYLGLRRIRAGALSAALVAPPRRGLWKLFYQGVLVNVLNPKTALFFFAFLPQFVDRTHGRVAQQMLLLGLLFVAMGICSDGAYALLAGAMGGWLRRHASLVHAQRLLSGGVLVLLGLATALGGL